MIRSVPRETFVKPHRAIALGKSATIGSARISTFDRGGDSRPAVLNTRRTPPAQAGSPVDRPGRIAASGLAAAASSEGLYLTPQRDGLLDALDGAVGGTRCRRPRARARALE